MTKTTDAEGGGSDIANAIIDAMASNDTSAFNRLFDRCVLSSNQKLFSELIQGLERIAVNADLDDRIKAVELLGALKDQRAEMVLSKILDDEFNEEIISQLALDPNHRSGLHYFLFRTITALLLIDCRKWNGVAEGIKQRFSGSWIENGIEASIKAIHECTEKKE